LIAHLVSQDGVWLSSNATLESIDDNYWNGLIDPDQ